jgi:hypothetical protein
MRRSCQQLERRRGQGKGSGPDGGEAVRRVRTWSNVLEPLAKGNEGCAFLEAGSGLLQEPPIVRASDCARSLFMLECSQSPDLLVWPSAGTAG